MTTEPSTPPASEPVVTASEAAASTGRTFTTAPFATQADAARYGWDAPAVASLAGVVARHGVVTVQVEWREEAPTSPGKYSDHPDRWGVAEPAPDGYVIREAADPTDAARAVEKGTRVPVPYRTADGGVEVAALWPLVMWKDRSPGWQWAHNGWGVERPGEILDSFDPLSPSADLPFEVRVFHVLDGVVGEDYGGSAPAWSTWAWCADPERAAELARAAVAHRLQVPQRRTDSGYVRAQVWRHDRYVNVMPSLLQTFDADPGRPVVPRLPFGSAVAGRPASTVPAEEPVWRRGEEHPPTYDLRVWTEEDGWQTIAWVVGGRGSASIAATLLKVGTGGPYRWAETWGPRHPDAWKHEWVQEGRALADYHPDMPSAEFSALIDTDRQAETDSLAAALASRSAGRLTVEQAQARLQAGAGAYRDFLQAGQVVVIDVLDRQRQGLPEGVERTAVRELLDAVRDRHQVPPGVVDLAWQRLEADEAAPGSRTTPGARTWRRRALREYLAPGTDTVGVPGLDPAVR